MIIAAMKSNPMFVDCIKEAVKIFDEFIETTITDEELNSLKGKKITFSNGDGDSLSFVIQSAKRNVEGFEFMVYGEKYRLAFTKVWLKELLTKGYCEHSYGDSIHKFSLK